MENAVYWYLKLRSNSMAKVSVIVPVYKVESFLTNCIDHLCGQTLEDIEIILIDDGSPDRCPQICDEYAAKDNRIKVIHKENGGVSAARNDGLKEASGEYVIYCDSDEWMENTGLEVLYSDAAETGADVVIGDVYLAYSGSTKYVKFYKNEFVTTDENYIRELIKADIYRTYCPDPPDEGYAFGYGGPWNKLVKRDFLLRNGICFDVKLQGIFDDILYTAYILAKAKTISYIQKPVYYYRQVESSITHRFKPNIEQINQNIFTAWENLFSKLDDPDDFSAPYYACVLRRIEESLRLYFKNPENNNPPKTNKVKFSEMLNKTPYKQAIRNVNLKKISKKQKIIAILSRLNLDYLIIDINIL